MKRIAIFASGGGSNAQKIMERFRTHQSIEVGLVVSNNPNAGVFNHAKTAGVETLLLAESQTKDPSELIQLLEHKKIDLVVLAGYLKKIPVELITNFTDRILNIHPSLLPKYGGKGMYGLNVHKAVKENGDLISGPTIHLVNEDYDKGRILFQKEVLLDITDSPEQIATKVLGVEHAEYSRVIEDYINQHYKSPD